MKMQNVLAANSTGDMAYLCGKCGHEVDKRANVCDNCGARLGGIRCPFCNFSGSADAFKNDTCPKCGRKSKTEKHSSNKQEAANNKKRKNDHNRSNNQTNLSLRQKSLRQEPFRQESLRKQSVITGKIFIISLICLIICAVAIACVYVIHFNLI